MDKKAFLVEDYKMRVDYLNNHFGRMWTRFNFFLTIQAGLVAFLFTKNGNSLSQVALPFLLAEILLSIIWWVFGAQDRALVETYRRGVVQVANRLSALGWVDDSDYVGKEDATKSGSSWNPVSWYEPRISITRLAAYVPLLSLAIWLLVAAIILLFSRRIYNLLVLPVVVWLFFIALILIGLALCRSAGQEDD